MCVLAIGTVLLSGSDFTMWVCSESSLALLLVIYFTVLSTVKIKLLYLLFLLFSANICLIIVLTQFDIFNQFKDSGRCIFP